MYHDYPHLLQKPRCRFLPNERTITYVPTTLHNVYDKVTSGHVIILKYTDRLLYNDACCSGAFNTPDAFRGLVFVSIDHHIQRQILFAHFDIGNLDIAVDYAYKKPQYFKNAARNHALCRSGFYQFDSRIRVVKAILTGYKPDTVYNNFVGVDNPPSSCSFDVKDKRYTPKACDEEVFKHFSELMEAWLVRGKPGDWRKFTGVYQGTHETLPGEEILLRHNKREIPFDLALSLAKKNGVPAYVQRIPKVGRTKSDGTVRCIYPMNTLYEAAIRCYTKGRSVEHDKVTFLVGHNYEAVKNLPCYDIANCDTHIMPYLYRYCTEDRWILIPYVLGDNLRVTKPSTFPSGVYHTSTVVSIFTAAAALAAGATHVYVQGDGFACEGDFDMRKFRFPVHCKGVGTINGFTYVGDQLCYTRAKERLYAPQYLRGYGPVGKTLFWVRHIAYRHLNAIDLPKPPACTCVGLTCKDPASCVRCGRILIDDDLKSFGRFCQIWNFGSLPKVVRDLLCDVKWDHKANDISSVKTTTTFKPVVRPRLTRLPMPDC